MKPFPLHRCENRSSLLFQLALAEFFSAYHTYLKLTETHPDKALKLLSGAATDYMRIFAWSNEEGYLTKLRNYVTLLLESEENVEAEPSLRKLSYCATRAWEGASKANDEIHSFKNQGKSLKKVPSLINALRRSIFNAIFYFESDENTLYYIIRHAAEFDHCFGQGACVKLMKKLFPNGLHEAQQYICYQYKKRQHAHLVPEIEAKIAALRDNYGIPSKSIR